MIRASLAVLLVLATGASGARHAAWLTPRVLSAVGAGDQRVAVDVRGNVTVAWAMDAGTGHGVVDAAYRPAGGRFGSSRAVSSPGLWAGPDLGVDRTGRATLVWANGNPPDVVVRVATRPAGGAVGPARTLDGPYHFVFSPRVAVNARGDAVAVWITTDSPLDSGSPGHFVLRAAFRRAGGTFGPPADVYAFDNDVTPRFELGIDANGGAALVLGTSRFPESAVHAFYRRAGGTFGTPRTMAVASAETTPNATFSAVGAPELAMDGHGDALAAWTASGSGDTVAQAAYRPAGGRWDSPVEVTDAGSCCNDTYRIALDAHGGALAVWVDIQGAVRVSTRTERGGWERSHALSRPGDRALTEPPAVAVGSRGDVIVAWTDLVPAVPTIEAAVRSPGGSFASARGVWSGPGFVLNPPQLAVDPQGNAVVAWQTVVSLHPRDTGPGHAWIQAAGYDGAGPQLRAPHIPRQGRVGVPIHFAVAPLDVWSAVASTRWTFGDGTGSTARRPVHPYRRAGSYTVTVTSTDTLGNAKSESRTVRIRAGRR